VILASFSDNFGNFLAVTFLATRYVAPLSLSTLGIRIAPLATLCFIMQDTVIFFK